MNNLEQNLHDYKSSDGLLISIKALCNNFFQDVANKDINALPEILKAKMNELYDKMNKEDLINAKNLKSAMEGINQAIVGTEEKALYELLDKKDELNRAIEAKREDIKNRLKISFEAAEEVVKDRNFSEKEEILELLNNAIIRETRLLGILKESAQIAFLTTLEGAKDVEETAGAIAKNMTYVAIIGGEFSKERILEISKNIIIAAANLADEGHIFAKELISGAISGTRDGILRAIERLKDEAKFAPDELRLNSQLLNLKNIDEEFIALLKELEKEFEGVARNEIENVINSELDTNLAKFKRISDQAREQIISRIEELKSNGMAKLMSEANNKFEALKQELNDKSKKLKLNFDTNDKIEEIKQEIANLEKKANEKFEDIKQIDIKSEAKKFGDRAYQAAKDLLNVIKKDKKED
ncbi:hypothetical protein B9N63_06370 [Campylobacter concisus]|uniref:hypothetical protein n=1 Tax=Campylobacter concisus TaxID=199 RepID=UPI000B3D633B|nr:hypothetical protein [Campylobacter concisus]OUT13643.1 hypothetical protein B9N63_06370 [Campylobacter concisus]